MNHSKLPWKVNVLDYSHATPPRKELVIINGEFILATLSWADGQDNPYVVQDEEAKANAELIVQAVNHYQAVLSALEAVAEFWAKYDGEEIPLPLYTQVQEAINQAKETQP